MADTGLPNETTQTQYTESQPIKTQHLILREASKFDLGAIHELYSNKDVMRYWSKPHVSVSQTESYLRNMFSSSNNGHLAFVIVLPPSAATTTSSTPPVATMMDEGKVIGHAGVWHPQRNELVFMIGSNYWRRGYMTEVLATLIPVFWEKGLKEVHADVNPDNEASLKLLRNAGFIQVGEDIVESYVGYCEQLRMELLNPNAGGEEKGDDGPDT